MLIHNGLRGFKGFFYEKTVKKPLYIKVNVY